MNVMRTGIVTLLLALALPGTGTVDALGAPFELKFKHGGHARVPFVLRNQLVWLRGAVNGSDSIWIVVDTGASASLMDENVARRLSLKLKGEHDAHGAGGTQQGSFAHNVTISIPGLSIRRERLPTTDLSAFGRQGGRPMELVLGYELFESRVVRFDYAAGIMDVWEVGQAPAVTGGATLPFTLDHNHPYVEAELVLPGRAPIRGRFVIDTGSAMALLVAPDVAARESVTTAFPTRITTLSRGVGGELKNQVGRAESFTLGGLSFSKPVVVVPEAGGQISVPGSIGNIGGQILGRCRVTFDYARKQIHLEQAENFERPFEADMLGATLHRLEDGVTVRWVNPGTPASESGLLVGDVVTHIDDEPAESIDPPTLRQRMQTEGRQVKLRLKRGTLSLEVTATLRRLI